MKVFKDMHDHLLKHPKKYLGLAVFLKVMLVGLLAVPVIQFIQNTYAQVPTTYDITATAGGNGTITPSGTFTVNEGDTVTFVGQANDGYVVSEFLDNGVSIGSNFGSVANHIIGSTTENHTISISFERADTLYTLTGSNGSAGGSISPEGGVMMLEGSNYTFNFIANNRYTLDYITIGGKPVYLYGDSSYTFTNIMGNYVVEAYYKIFPTIVKINVDCGNLKTFKTTLSNPITIIGSKDKNNYLYIDDNVATFKGGGSVDGEFLINNELTRDGEHTLTMKQYTRMEYDGGKGSAYLSKDYSYTFNVNCGLSTSAGGGSSRQKDSCCIHSNSEQYVVGENPLCEDTSKGKNSNNIDSYDGICADCLNHPELKACLDLETKVKMISNLNDMFYKILGNTTKNTQKITKTIETTEKNNLITVLKGLATSLVNLNNTFSAIK